MPNPHADEESQRDRIERLPQGAERTINQEISEQPSMSPEASIEQIKRIAEQSIIAPMKSAHVFRRL